MSEVVVQPPVAATHTPDEVQSVISDAIIEHAIELVMLEGAVPVLTSESEHFASEELSSEVVSADEDEEFIPKGQGERVTAGIITKGGRPQKDSKKGTDDGSEEKAKAAAAAKAKKEAEEKQKAAAAKAKADTGKKPKTSTLSRPPKQG